MPTRKALFVCVAVLAFAAGNAHGSLLTFSFDGHVDNDPFGLFDTADFSGAYSFDSAIAQVLNTPNSGGYAGSGSPYEMTVAFTGAADPSASGPYVADTLNITVNDDFPGPLDEYLVTGRSATDSFLSIEIRLDDFSGTAFSSTALPLTPPALSSFSSARFALFDGTLDNPIEAEGVLTSLRCTAGCVRTVPEPGTLFLAAVAGVLGWTRHRTRRRDKNAEACIR